MEAQKRDKKKIQTEQQIFHIIINIVEAYPQYTLAQHMAHVLRKKGGKERGLFLV